MSERNVFSDPELTGLVVIEQEVEDLSDTGQMKIAELKQALLGRRESVIRERGIKVGDRVTLKTGSPALNVELVQSVRGKNLVFVVAVVAGKPRLVGFTPDELNLLA